MEHFNVLRTSLNSKARAGEIKTSHGVVPTPCFMPVGSQATVKTLTPDDLEQLGVRMILSNTYHLYLRPGIDIIHNFGGLHKFMGWSRPILTDSGGFQIFSLAPLRELNDKGVLFRSHIDGSQHLFTPELAIRYQEKLGSDIIMVLDECPSHDAPKERIEQAMARTHAWAMRCRNAFHSNNQFLYGIVQGGLFPDLREQSVRFLTSLDFSGYAIGGLSLGETKVQMYEIISFTTEMLPDDKPRYLMGVGSPEDIVESVIRGVDIFDCVLPTRIARHGSLFSWQGRVNIRNAKFKKSAEPVIPGCTCYTCRNFTAAYLHHLFNAGELLAFRLATVHNLFFMESLMGKIRETIIAGDFTEFARDFLASYNPTDEETRINQKQKWLAKYNNRD